MDCCGNVMPEVPIKRVWDPVEKTEIFFYQKAYEWDIGGINLMVNRPQMVALVKRGLLDWYSDDPSSSEKIADIITDDR